MTKWKGMFAHVHGALLRRGRSAADADDAVQEAWIRLEFYERTHVVSQPEAFMMRAALNLSIDRHRAELRRGEVLELEEADESHLLATVPSAEAVALSREQLARLGACLSRMAERTREMFVAYRVDGLTYAEIATLHKVSVPTVERHVSRATEMIAHWMRGW